MSQEVIGALLEKRRSALVDLAISLVGGTDGKYAFTKSVDDLHELLRTDPQDNFAVPATWGSSVIATAQDFINAVYAKLEPGYEQVRFSEEDVQSWASWFSTYPTWAASQQIRIHPENYIDATVRLRKTRLFSNLETELNQGRLTVDSAQKAVRTYLEEFGKHCNQDIRAVYSHGNSNVDARYFTLGRDREQPRGYHLREARIRLQPGAEEMNPAGWEESTAVDVAVRGEVLDMRPALFNGRVCLVWVERHESNGDETGPEGGAFKVEIKIAFRSQSNTWSAPLSVRTAWFDTEPPADSRLIAIVKEDAVEPRGRLGVVYLDPSDKPLLAPIVFNTLMSVLDDDGEWLMVLAERFPGRWEVQHSLNQSTQPQVSEEVVEAGSLNPSFGLETLFFQRKGSDILAVRGICKANTVAVEPPDKPVDFDLTLLDPSGSDPVKDTVLAPVNGPWATKWLIYKRSAGGFSSNARFELGATTATGFGRIRYTLKMSDLKTLPAARLEKNAGNEAQFLAFNDPATLARIRINTLFTPQLQHLSAISLEAVFAWSTQFIAEPPPDGGPISEPNGAFNGANGLYFWELFFHLPHLIATRLQAEERFKEAREWLHLVFNPQSAAEPSNPPQPTDKPRYWNCRPLTRPGLAYWDWQSAVDVDPDIIAYSAPIHFQILMFTTYVRLLIAEGDFHFRRLTQDSLLVAKQAYVRAKSMLGSEPSTRSLVDWEPKTLGDLLKESEARPVLEAFASTHDYSLANIPLSETKPVLGVLGSEAFRLPANQMLLELFRLPEYRLSNLRNNLTIDGKIRSLPIYPAAADPRLLLINLAAGGSAGSNLVGGMVLVGAFAWGTLREHAMRTVADAQDYAEKVLSLTERREMAEREELQYAQMAELGQLAEAAQDRVIAQMQATLEALRASRDAAQIRLDTIASWFDENVSAPEQRVMDALNTAKILGLTSTAIRAVAGGLNVLPRIFGTANGGGEYGAPVNAVADGIQIASQALLIGAEKDAQAEIYRRRRLEWGLQKTVTQAEVRSMDAQILAQEHALAASLANMAHTRLANSQARDMFNFLKKRVSNPVLYDWMLGQLRASYYQTYDVARSMCLTVQAALIAETGLYGSDKPVPMVWNEKFSGMTAANGLRDFLQRLEREYLQSYERRLQRVVTISLRQLFDDPVEPQAGFSSWDEALAHLIKTGELEWEITQLFLHRRNPGDYCCLIQMLSVTVPALLGPYQDFNARLMQISNRILWAPSTAAALYLYKPDSTVAPPGVMFNVRSGQEIAVSSGLEDNGQTLEDKEPGLKRPFADCGAVSRWKLFVAWPEKPAQAAMLEGVTDVILHMRYSARSGDASFELAIKDMVNEHEAKAANRRRAGSGNHG